MSRLIIASHDDVLAHGWTGEQLLHRLIELDTTHVHDMDETDEGTAAQWAPVFMQNPHTWSLLVDASRLPSPSAVVGYWSFCTLQAAAYDDALAGSLNDSEITTALVDPISGPGEYDAYIVMFVIAESARKPGVVMLVRAFFDNLRALAEQGVFIRRLSANAFTPAGVRLCRDVLLLAPQSAHSKRGEIWARTLLPATGDTFSASFAELNALYRAHGAAVNPRELCCAV